MQRNAVVPIDPFVIERVVAKKAPVSRLDFGRRRSPLRAGERRREPKLTIRRLLVDDVDADGPADRHREDAHRVVDVVVRVRRDLLRQRVEKVGEAEQRELGAPLKLRLGHRRRCR